MSHQITAAIAQIDFARATTRWVASTLAAFGDADGARIYPAVATVAERAGVSVRTARREIHRLAVLGLIVLEVPGGGRRHQSGCRGRTSVYRVNRQLLSDLLTGAATWRGLTEAAAARGLLDERGDVTAAAVDEVRKGARSAVHPAEIVEIVKETARAVRDRLKGARNPQRRCRGNIRSWSEWLKGARGAGNPYEVERKRERRFHDPGDLARLLSARRPASPALSILGQLRLMSIGDGLRVTVPPGVDLCPRGVSDLRYAILVALGCSEVEIDFA